MQKDQQKLAELIRGKKVPIIRCLSMCVSGWHAFALLA